MLFQYTPFETGFNNSKNYTAVMILGCGVVIINNAETVDQCNAAGYKLHNVMGRKVGFALFTKQV